MPPELSGVTDGSSFTVKVGAVESIDTLLTNPSPLPALALRKRLSVQVSPALAVLPATMALWAVVDRYGIDGVIARAANEEAPYWLGLAIQFDDKAVAAGWGRIGELHSGEQGSTRRRAIGLERLQ